MRRLLACALLLATAACGGADEAPPVATPSFTASKTRVPLGSPVEFTYTFDVAQDAQIQGDYQVFVHFIDADGQQMWADDHAPAIPTSQWTPGQKVQYTRTVFVPIYPYHGPATVTMGLYNGPTLTDRLALNAEGEGREYAVGTLELTPQSESIYLTFGDGWHAPELSPDGSAREWQWMMTSGTLTFRNPKQDVTLYLDANGRPDLFAEAQVVTLLVNGTEAHRFTMDDVNSVLRRLPITAAQLGDGDTVQIRLDADQSFVPAQMPNMGTDPRELSIRVFHAFVEAK